MRKTLFVALGSLSIYSASCYSADDLLARQPVCHLRARWHESLGLRTSGSANERAHYTYDPLSRTDVLQRPNGTSTDYGYDLASHLTSLKGELVGTDQDLERTFA